MLAFEFLNAQHGDSFLIRWGDPQRVMLVDGGPNAVYEATLRNRISALPRPSANQNPTLDIVCVSHIDDDHIVGVLRLLTELDRARRDKLAPPFHVARLWHNSIETLLDAITPGVTASAASLLEHARSENVVAASYQQGADVRRLASSLGLAGNTPFNGPIISGTTTNCDGLDVTVVAPDQTALETLAQKWKVAIDRRDSSVIAAAYADRSAPNLSSIALHVQYGDRTALLTGDSRGDHLLAGLDATRLARPDTVLKVDLLKLPHHGSANNAGPSLFERIHADHYIVSADGIRHHHPNETTLQWLVESRHPGEEYAIHLTNPIPFALTELERLQQNRRFRINVRAPDASSIVVDLAE